MISAYMEVGHFPLTSKHTNIQHLPAAFRRKNVLINKRAVEPLTAEGV